MAERHPYISSQVALIQVLDHLRKSFPATLNSDTLKKLGFAPGNESYFLNIARYLKLIDENGSRQDDAHKVFTQHDDAVFRGGFSDLVKTSYSGLFELHHEEAWNLADAALITFFRQSDQSSQLVGTRQAFTFKSLAQYSGQTRAQALLDSGQKVAKRAPLKTRAARTSGDNGSNNKKSAHFIIDENARPKDRGNVGLTVRIEVNLPSGGDQETYDRIFRSIRENLLSD